MNLRFGIRDQFGCDLFWFFIYRLFFGRRLWTFRLRLIVHLRVPILTWSQTRVKSWLHSSLEGIVDLTFREYCLKLLPFFVGCGGSYFLCLTGLSFPWLLFSNGIGGLLSNLFGGTRQWLSESGDFFLFYYCARWKSFDAVPCIYLLG